MGIRVVPPAAGGVLEALFMRRIESGSLTVVTDAVSVVAAATLTIQPPAGQSYLVDSLLVDSALTNAQIALTDGSVTTGAMFLFGSRDGNYNQGVGICLPITNGVYLSWTNGTGADRKVYMQAVRGDLIPGVTVVAGINSLAGAGGTATYRPPANKVWFIPSWGTPNGAMDTLYQATDGTIFCSLYPRHWLAQQPENLGRRDPLWLTRNTYVVVTNNNAAAKVTWYAGLEVADTLVPVVSEVFNVAPLTTVDKVHATELWAITHFTFTYNPTSATVSLYDGADEFPFGNYQPMGSPRYVSSTASKLRFANAHATNTYSGFYCGVKWTS